MIIYSYLILFLFQEWFLDHKKKCLRNFEGKLGETEVKAAVTMWSKSTHLGFRYTTFIGDGDSGAYKAVCALNNSTDPYDCSVVKKEYINHVDKRLGARMRSLKSLQSRVWRKVSKDKYAGLHRVRFVSNDNLGAQF